MDSQGVAREGDHWQCLICFGCVKSADYTLDDFRRIHVSKHPIQAMALAGCARFYHKGINLQQLEDDQLIQPNSVAACRTLMMQRLKGSWTCSKDILMILQADLVQKLKTTLFLYSKLNTKLNSCSYDNWFVNARDLCLAVHGYGDRHDHTEGYILLENCKIILKVTKSKTKQQEKEIKQKADPSVASVNAQMVSPNTRIQQRLLALENDMK